MRNRLGYNITSTLRETRDQILEASSALHDLRVTIEGLSDENLRALSTWCSGLDAEYVLKLARIFGSYHAKAGVLVDTPSQGPVRRREFATPYHDEVPGEEDPLAGTPYTPGRFENPGRPGALDYDDFIAGRIGRDVFVACKVGLRGADGEIVYPVMFSPIFTHDPDQETDVQFFEGHEMALILSNMAKDPRCSVPPLSLFSRSTFDEFVALCEKMLRE
jgi:hypothetical protein